MMAHSLNHNLNNVDYNISQFLVQSSRIGSAILKMAELNLKLQGPVDELIVTIK